VELTIPLLTIPLLAGLRYYLVISREGLPTPVFFSWHVGLTNLGEAQWAQDAAGVWSHGSGVGFPTAAFRINVVPAPGVLTLLGLAFAAAGRRRRPARARA
jgi:uncharacterized protein (TIGR03382 family)